MLLPVKFKLKPNNQQRQEAESWQGMVRAFTNFTLRDRIDTYAQSFAEGAFCDLQTKGEAVPLTCSVSRSASVGEPWKGGEPAKRDNKTKGIRKGDITPYAKRSPYEMHSAYLTAMKKERPWYQRLESTVLQQALRNQDKAFQNFFAGRAKFPRFKRTSDVDSLEYGAGRIAFDEPNRKVYLPSLGWMGYFASRPLGTPGEDYRVKTSWLKFEADGLYVVALLDYRGIADFPQKADDELQTVNGLDRGVKKIIAGADGTVEPNPGFAKKNQRRLEIRQRRLSRKKKGSSNRKKQANRVARVHQKTKRQRDDFQWKLARREAQKADVIGLEDLNIRGMRARCKPKKDPETGKYLKNGQSAKSGLSKAIQNAAWYSLDLKLRHQAKKFGNRVELVPAYRSSQECSECHHVSPTNRDKEKFLCENCGHHEDADVNAGVNIAQRTIEKLGIDTLRVVSPKVTPKPESTGSRKRESRAGLPALPGNQSNDRETPTLPVQLGLFRPDIGSEWGDDRAPSKESPVIARSASRWEDVNFSSMLHLHIPEYYPDSPGLDLRIGDRIAIRTAGGWLPGIVQAVPMEFVVVIVAGETVTLDLAPGGGDWGSIGVSERQLLRLLNCSTSTPVEALCRICSHCIVSC